MNFFQWSDDEIMSENHEMIMRCKRVMVTMTSAEMKHRQKIMIKKATYLLLDANRNMAFWGAICYTGFFERTISGNY